MNIKWAQVLKAWQESEEQQWEPLYTERGYENWWEWRESYITELNLAQREWTEKIVVEPHNYVEHLHVGGYRGWQQYRPANKDAATFRDVANPLVEDETNVAGGKRVDVRTNKKVMDLIGNVHDTTILLLKSGTFQVLLDGHHRCAAIAVEAIDGPRSNFSLTVRTCQFPESELHLLTSFAQDREAIMKKNT